MATVYSIDGARMSKLTTDSFIATVGVDQNSNTHNFKKELFFPHLDNEIKMHHDRMDVCFFIASTSTDRSLTGNLLQPAKEDIKQTAPDQVTATVRSLKWHRLYIETYRFVGRENW